MDDGAAEIAHAFSAFAKVCKRAAGSERTMREVILGRRGVLKPGNLKPIDDPAESGGKSKPAGHRDHP